MVADDTNHDRPRGVFVGLSTLDIVHRVKALPASNMKATASRQDISAGGPALNAAVTFTALGGKAILVSCVGEGATGRLVREDLHECGVRLIDLAPPGFSLPVSSVVVEEQSGDRQIVSTDAALTPALPPDVLNQQMRKALDGCHVALFDGHHQHLALPIAEYLASHTNPPTVLDAGRWKPGMRELIPLISDVICSADFRLPEQSADGTLMQELLRSGARTAAVTNGGGPITWATTTGSGSVAAEETDVVDSLGAGDVFHGAYAFARSAGRPVPDDSDVSAHLAFAAHTAALKCAHPGTRSWLSQLQKTIRPEIRESTR
ncbi:MAG: yihV [Arthrobacter sp.]|nr:yihV [Arthrobacter sp.]